MPKITIITEESKLAIIDWYNKGRSIGWLMSKFHCGKNKIISILTEANTIIRTKEEQVKLGTYWNKQSVLEHYGVDCIWKLPEFLEMRKQTCLNKYGVEFVTQLDTTIEKQKKTNLERYGAEHPIQSCEIKQKIENTNIEKYGCKNPMQNSNIQKKVIKTKNNYTDKQKMLILNKRKMTCQTKYGADFYMQTLEYHKKARKHYTYKNEIFDSFPELAFYMYYDIYNSSIQRCPDAFIYFYNGIQHYYFPDFLVEGQYYEIKGNQFLKEDETWQCPFDHLLDTLYEAKHQCALENNVKILYNKEYRKYTNWFKRNNYKKEDFLVKEKENE